MQKKSNFRKNAAKIPVFTVVVLLVIALSLSISFILPIETVKAHDFSTWGNWKLCHIANANNSYQMKINVTKSSGGDVDCEGNCQDDFSDIRFADIDDNASLDFWMQTYSSGSYAVFWVETPSYVESDEAIILWYNKYGVTTTSNGDDTFVFFDNFTGTDWDDTKWYQDSGSVIEVGNGYMYLNSTDDRGLLHSNYSAGIVNWSHNHACGSRAVFTNDQLNGISWCGWAEYGANNASLLHGDPSDNAELWAANNDEDTTADNWKSLVDGK